METQPGSVNWAPLNNALNKGEARVMAWHAVAHGADAVLYWQWRSALGGQEQYHGSLVDQSHQPRPFYAEAQQVGRDFAAAGALLAGSSPVAEVALLNCYDSRWSIQAQRHHKDFEYVAHFLNYYRPLAARNINTDVISADAEVGSYKLVIAPALLKLNETRAARLADYVRQGGHLVLTIRSGMKDDFNALLPMRQPGALAEAAGVEVEEFYALPETILIRGDGEGVMGLARLWAERLKVRDEANTQVIARYGASNGWLDGQPAITVHAYGQGLVYFVGAYLDEAVQQLLLDRVTQAAGVKSVLITPAGVEAHTRVNSAGREIFILINHERTEQTVSLPWPAQEHLRGQRVTEQLELAPYEIAVLTPAGGP